MKNDAKFKIRDSKLHNYLLRSRQNHALVGWGGRPLVEPTSESKFLLSPFLQQRNSKNPPRRQAILNLAF
jgi:hypothetical protein